MSTSTPRRASLYARSPPIFTAEAAGIGSSTSPRRRASAPSTSAREGPACRSTTSPSGSPVVVGDERELTADEVDDVADRPLRGEARGLPVAAASCLTGDRGDVDLVVAGAERDAAGGPLVPRRLANQCHHLRTFDRPERVDQSLRVRLLGADVAEVVLEQVGDDEAPT